MRYIDLGTNPTTNPDPLLTVTSRKLGRNSNLDTCFIIGPNPTPQSSPDSPPLGKSFTKIPILPDFDPTTNPNDIPNTLDLII